MEPAKKLKPAILTLETTAFTNGRRMPTRHTGDGVNVSPSLSWFHVPRGTVTMALICEDPDAPEDEPWVHWLIYNIPAFRLRLPEGISRREEPEEVDGAFQGINSSGTVGYDGPSPPVGHGTHHYTFTLYAVDRALDLRPRATKEVLLRALKGHVLATAAIMATYSR